MWKMSYYHDVEEVLRREDVKTLFLSVFDRTSELFRERGLLDPDSHLILGKYPLFSYAEFFGIELPKLFLKGNRSFTSRLAVPVTDSPIFKRGAHKRKPLYGEYLGSLDTRDFDTQLPSGLIILTGLADLLGFEPNPHKIPEEGITYVLLPHDEATRETEPHFLDALVRWGKG